MKMARVIFIGLLILSLFLNFWLISNFSRRRSDSAPDNAEDLRIKYPYLSQRILREYDRDLLINFSPLRRELRQLINGDFGNDFSLYFEYLPTGVSIGVNEKTEFISASLMKVPLVMAYLHKKEASGIEEDPTVTIEEKHIDRDFGDLWQKGAGFKIHLSEVVGLALRESDNTAINLISSNISQEDYQFILEGLDLPLKVESNKQAFITTKGYSSIFKALYFSALLSKDNSQYVLDLLTKSIFLDKLAAGVPDNIPIAHKVGVYYGTQNPVFADCGIIYLEKRNYLLCMASRSDEATATERMKRVSETVYHFVSSTELEN